MFMLDQQDQFKFRSPEDEDGTIWKNQKADLGHKLRQQQHSLVNYPISDYETAIYTRDAMSVIQAMHINSGATFDNCAHTLYISRQSNDVL